MIIGKIIFFIFLFALTTFARTIYVGPNEYNKTVMSGIDDMNGGDTLIIRNGAYLGIENRVDDIPSGTVDNYTYIRAENTWQVTIDVQQVPGSYGCYISNRSYIVVEGIHFTNSDLTNVSVSSRSSYIKIIKCAGSETSGGNHYNFAVRRSQYVLVEDCFAFGFGRYSFLGTGQSFDDMYVVFRRCVARNDNVGNDPGDGRQTASFGSYQENNVYFQNCIAIDGIEDPDPYSTFIWMTPNGANNIKFQGCIQVNNIGHLWYWEGSDVTPSTNIEVENCLFIGNIPGPNRTNRRYSGQNSESSSASIRNISVIDCNNYIAGLHSSVTGTYTVENSMFWNNSLNSGYMVQNAISDSTLFWGNNVSNFNTFAGNNATNVYDNTPANMDPKNGYTYAPLREPGSQLANIGMGHDIRYRRGISGTFYGEPGWDKLTDEPLWPWEDEDVIKEKMKAYSAHGMTGNRGYCATDQSLTNYIMGWLGNGSPYFKYLVSPDNTRISN